MSEKSPTGGSSNTDNDHLRLASNSVVLKMLAKNGAAAETVLFSVKVTKVNRKDKQQTRALLITDAALYNLDPANFSKCKRRIEIPNVGSITVSQKSEEFVLHIPDEYDYRFLSPLKDDITKCLKKQYKAITGKSLKTAYVMEDELGDITWTKDKVKHIPREEQMRIKKQLAAEEHDSDKEVDDSKEVEQILKGTEKVTIDSFDLIKVLGRGSFGKVMMVKKKDTGVIYAMKILKKAMIVARQQVEHTKAERAILETFQHPFLMGLRFAFQTPAKLYMVMDFFKGGELFFHLKNKRRFTEAEARIFVAEVALGLGKLHSLHYIYRDLKPENILMDENGHVCLTDFGLSKNIDPESGEEATTFCGTPEYLAPEILKGGTHGKAVDWWSLGILLYELTVGIPPFYSQNVNEMYHKIQHGALRFPPFLSEECRDLIVALLNRNPEQRLGSSEKDVEELQVHPFFASIDWDKMLRKEIDPPYKPKVKTGDTDVSNFDNTFVSEPVVDSFVEDPKLSDNGGFDGFTFVTQGDKLKGDN
jgi:serum/glucocorticoid-regulated kinase 2